MTNDVVYNECQTCRSTNLRKRSCSKLIRSDMWVCLMLQNGQGWLGTRFLFSQNSSAASQSLTAALREKSCDKRSGWRWKIDSIINSTAACPGHCLLPLPTQKNKLAAAAQLKFPQKFMDSMLMRINQCDRKNIMLACSGEIYNAFSTQLIWFLGIWERKNFRWEFRRQRQRTARD